MISPLRIVSGLAISGLAVSGLAVSGLVVSAAMFSSLGGTEGTASVHAAVAEGLSVDGLRSTASSAAGSADGVGPAGILCPDGQVVPPLNGVRPGDPIPALHRSRDLPPMGSVVRLWRDAEGTDWWLTDRGAAFTTRWATASLADGSLRRFVRLDQVEPLADGAGVGLPLDGGVVDPDRPTSR